MSDQKDKQRGSLPPPGFGQHPLPRRASPDKSITLRHHRLARSASQKPSLDDQPTSSPRRNSSGESYETGHSDAKTWFNQSNENPRTFDSQAMDVDPPFYQKETDSSNDDASKIRTPRFPLGPAVSAAMRPPAVDSSSTDDYRSVIDDLTVEIQKLKEQLKKYRQIAPDTMKGDKLFEIKVHGLPKRKKRELEATLREFAAGLGRSPSAEASSSQRKKSSKRQNRVYSGSGSNSKYQTSSSGSRSRPVDSAYASASTGANSSGTSLARPSISSRARSSDQKVESYLKDIPEGLYPHHVVMTDKEKKKLIVRRLEHLFTGKISGRNLRRNQSLPPVGVPLAPVMAEEQGGGATMVHQPPSLQPEPSREAKILQPDGSHKKSRSGGNGSASHSNGDQTESGGGNTNTTGGTNTTPPIASPHEQRPTRPRDLDPDRVQIPSENMEYIRHLGLVPPELVSAPWTTQDVSPDAEGWVYLNLLCNLAQLHMVNVAPDFIRAAVAERSSKLQLSPDGRKVRWRGGTDNSKFSSDSSGDNSQKSPSTDETDSSNKDGQRKRQKTKPTFAGGNLAPGSSNNMSNRLTSASSQSFHYKPIFVRKSPSQEMSADETGSSFAPIEESNVDDSRWGNSGSGSSQRKKRRLDGAIIYYSGAPFCIDLSGDPGDVSPETYSSLVHEPHYADSGGLTSTSIAVEMSPALRPVVLRTSSGSSLPYRPFSNDWHFATEDMDVEENELDPGLDAENTTEDGSDGLEFDSPWSDSPQVLRECRLEPCGIGGILPDDHFLVSVTSRRPQLDVGGRSRSSSSRNTEHIINRLAAMSTSSPTLGPEHRSIRTMNLPVKIEYISGRIKRLAPVPLPPPASFFPPFSSGSSEAEVDESDSETDEDAIESSEEEELMSRRANPHQSDKDYPDNEEITSADEQGEESEDEESPTRAAARLADVDMKELAGPEDETDDAIEARRTFLKRGSARRSSGGTAGPSLTGPGALVTTGSSVATAGGAESGYNTSAEES